MNTARAALYALVVIFLANFFNYLDRQLVSALEKPLSSSLRLEEWEYFLLWTLFTVGYMVCAVPIGLLADRISRTRLFAACIVIWSVATIASGLAETKWILYAARVFIGVGEAGCLVIGPSLISDLFTQSYRSRALSAFFLAMPLGGTAAFLLAGACEKFGIDWRTMFFVAGAPGFLIALLIWLLSDPTRGGSEGAHHGMHGGGSLADYLKLLRTPTLLLIILAQAFSVIILVPLIHGGVRFFEDTRGLSGPEAKVALGLMALLGGGAGSVASGWLGDKLFKRTKRAYSLLAAIAFAAAWPCLLVGFLSDIKAVYLTALTAGSFFLFLCMPAVNTQIANVVNPAQRSTAWALAVFILHLLGDTLAPPVFGLASKSIGRQQAFVIFSFGLLLAGACCVIAVFTSKRDTERIQMLVQEGSMESSTLAGERETQGASEGIPETSGA